ncbi:MAG: type II toxin-antitoxin system Phd/YefM family antitoxin [Labilithrix sp.]|nr:type II toxin-antitoxin system Phd/YefM family antitoxin [Labilithrix sp.]MCW5810957.1 type II toxin-antitoxin system Phd/YefM family antitoxin [Labilithrix sp.]
MQRRAEITIPAAQFKAKCLALMERVAATGEEVVITKHGRPVAKLVQAVEPRKSSFGFAKDMVLYMGDVMSPAIDPADWEPDEEELRLVGALPAPTPKRRSKKKR